MMPRVDAWVQRNGLKLVVGLALGVAAWVRLEAQVSDKISSVVYTQHVVREDSLVIEIIHKLDRIEENQRMEHAFTCAAHPRDYGCQK